MPACRKTQPLLGILPVQRWMRSGRQEGHLGRPTTARTQAIQWATGGRGESRDGSGNTRNQTIHACAEYRCWRVHWLAHEQPHTAGAPLRCICAWRSPTNSAVPRLTADTGETTTIPRQTNACSDRIGGPPAPNAPTRARRAADGVSSPHMRVTLPHEIHGDPGSSGGQMRRRRTSTARPVRQEDSAWNATDAHPERARDRDRGCACRHCGGTCTP